MPLRDLSMSSVLLDFLRRQYAPPESDAELVRRFVADRNGDAFAVLVRRHGPAVLGLCRRRLGEFDVDDAFQAVFVTLARKAAHLRRPESLAAWLHGVAIRVCGNALVARNRRQRTEGRARPRKSSDPVSELSAQELLSALDEELQNLPVRERLPLLLVYWQGRSQTEAAQVLGLTAGSLRGRLDRGRHRLAQRLRARGFAPGELRSLLIVPMGVAKISTDLVTRTVAMTTGGATVSAAVAALTVVGTSGTIVPAIGLTMMLGTVAFVAWLGTSTPQAAQKPERPTASAQTKDRDGNTLPPGAVMRLGSLRMKHPASEFTTLLSKMLPNGSRALTWNRESLHVWDLALEKSLGEIRFTSPPGFRAMSLNGDMAAFEVKDEMVIIDLDAVRVRKTFPAKGNQEFHRLRAAAFSPNGQRLAWYRAGGLKLWDIDSATEIGSFTGGLQFAQDLTFTPDGSVLVGACLDEPDGRKAAIVRWDTKSLTMLTESKISVTSPHPRLSRNGDRVAIPEFNPRATTLMSTVTGEIRHLLPIDAFDYHFANDDQQVVTISGAPDGVNYRATVWNVETGAQLREVSFGRHPGGGHSVSQDGERLLLACLGPMVFNLKTGIWTNYGTGHKEPIHRIQFTPDGGRLLTNDNSSSICWELASGNAIGELSHHGMMKVRSNHDAVLIEPERAAVVALPEMKRELRSLEVNYPKQRSGHTWYANDVAIPKDGKSAAAYITSHPYGGVRGGESHEFIHGWDLTSGKAEVPLPPPTGFSPIRFRRGGREMLGTHNTSPGTPIGIVSDALVELGTGRQRFANAVPHDLYLRHGFFSPDGQTIGTMGFVRTGGDENSITGYHTFTLREIRTNQECLRMRLDDRKSHDLTFGLAGNGLIAIPTGSQIEIRDGLGDIVTTFRNVSNAVRKIAFRPDGRQMATGHGDGTVLLWDMPSQKTGDAKPDAAELAKWWEQLKSDPPTAYRAMTLLARNPTSATALLTARLAPAAPDLTPRIRMILAEVDGNEYKKRQLASEELSRFVEPARPLLESFEKEPLGPEPARRLKQLLDRPDIVTDPELLRALRSVELLERLGTPAAKLSLKKLAGGATGNRLTCDAQDALTRLSP